jgi:SlyX protein
MSEDTDSRIEALETTLAFQEQTIEELSQALAEQYRQIETLRRELKHLGAQLCDVESHPALATGREPPPPHY